MPLLKEGDKIKPKDDEEAIRYFEVTEDQTEINKVKGVFFYLDTEYPLTTLNHYLDLSKIEEPTTIIMDSQDLWNLN